MNPPYPELPSSACDTKPKEVLGINFCLYIHYQTPSSSHSLHTIASKIFLSFSLPLCLSAFVLCFATESFIFTGMSAASSTRPETRVPPRRGQVKSRIFETLKKTVVSAVADLARSRGDGANTAAGTPPASAYNSDANSEIP
ncbi:hypothetical protein OWV82_004735 [Melia azedarach]|uniref:Uncharacterized protein n=1 Tax=Melia azedarach TaxID=155640 RepID=A0ACC1YR78_MELAZ|nr:hypothetical protein OWV82_004735 [Melia azedarach]